MRVDNILTTFAPRTEFKKKKRLNEGIKIKMFSCFAYTLEYIQRKNADAAFLKLQ